MTESVFPRFQKPGLIVEPFIFTIILYFLAELRPTLYAFLMTSLVTVFVMNIATACGKTDQILIANCESRC